jgi:cell division protein ZapA (FtsZ GTPase activity inhibitor)
MNATPGNEDTHSHWQELAPVLDEAMHDLKAQDREALLLRYFQDSDFKSMGTALGLSEGAAQMRVSRTLERLRRALARRGIAISATALSATLGSDAVISAPAGLAASAASTALASAATDSGSALSLIKLMTMTKLKAGVIAAIAVAGVATPLAVQHQTQVKLREENQSLRQQARELDQLKTENGRLSNLLAQANGSQLSKEQLSELMKLRGEVGLLRRQTNEQGKLLATTGALNPSTNEVKPDAVNPQIIPRESWAFVGYSTPEDALQSIAWAMSKGDVKKFLASLSPATQRAYAQRFEGKTEDEMAAMLQDEIRGLPALRLDRKKGSGDGELAFILYSKEFYDGTTRTKDEAVMTFMDIGGEWKLHEPNQSATNVSPSDAAR